MAEQEEKKKKTCGYHLCKRKTWNDDKRCIFHSVDIEGKKEEFAEAFWQEFERQKVKDKEYDFRDFVFPDDISFEGKEFEKDVNFFAAQFFGGAYFSMVRFSGEAYFHEAQFYRKAHFLVTQFLGKADFPRARFFGEVLFLGSRFAGDADFRETRFAGDADFLETQFSGDKLLGLFEELRNKGIKRIWERRYKIKDFRFYMSEAIAREYPVIDRMARDAWYLDDYKKNHPFIYALWNVMAKCGQSILRWATWSLFFALYFAINFYLIDYAFPTAFHFNDSIQQPTFWSYIYYSIVTFTTLGFGDIIPTLEWVQRWVMAEVIMGYVMLGGLISILANKLARRS